jgi:hypothetical protein
LLLPIACLQLDSLRHGLRASQALRKIET